MKNPNVSVIIPTYNRAHLVGRAIQSVLNQTYQDFEIIVVDDGSTDNTREVIKEFQEQDKRIKYIKHEKNKGGSAARNTGIKAARGEYIAFQDSDDEWLPKKLDVQVKSIKSKEYQFVFCGREIINNKKRYYKINKKIYLTMNDMLWENSLGGMSLIVVKSDLAKKILFDEKLTAAQDYDFYIRSLEICKKAINIPKVLVKIYQNSNDRITTNIKKKYMGNKRFIVKHFKKMNTNQKKYHLYKYRLLEWSKNPNRNLKYLIKGLIIYPWWKKMIGYKMVLGSMKQRLILQMNKKI